MAEQTADAAFRQQIAQWTRTALGNVVEDDGALQVSILQIMDEMELTGRLFHLRLLCGIVEEEALIGDKAAPR